MTSLENLNRLVKEAKIYRLKANDSLARNRHMHECDALISQEKIDALLTDFINTIAMHHGVDFGLYSSDLKDNDNYIIR